MRFEEWTLHPPRGKAILLDIDGTLVPSGATEVTHETVAAVGRLREYNDVFIFSNKNRPERNRAIAQTISVPLIESTVRKPRLGVLESIVSELPLIIVGDKLLTDGFLAYRAHADFVRVTRLTSIEESWLDKFLNAVDDIMWHALHLTRLLRVDHWVKNLLVFAPLFFARLALSPIAWSTAAAGFSMFCFVTSAGYIINDIADAQSDRGHVRKKFRPIASGEIPLWVGWLTCAMLLIAALLVATLSSLPTEASILVGIYFVCSVLYSAFLKHVAIVEMLFFIGFYLARVLVGGIVTNVPLSAWLILSIVFLSLFLVSAKRYAESRSGRSRRVLGRYSLEFLQGMLYISAALVVAFYALYSVLGVESPFAVYSSLPVLAGVMRYLQLTLTSTDAEYPERLLFKDPGMLVIGIVWFISILAVFY